jgi:hypothetical protein
MTDNDDEYDTSHLAPSLEFEPEELAEFECSECGIVRAFPEWLLEHDPKGHCSNHEEGGRQVVWEKVE